MGPVATRPQFDRVMGFLDEARAAGASFACGGGRPEGGEGLFVAPTVVTDVRPDMRIVQEEVFGPVVAALTFETEEEAVRVANDTRFGLGAGVWTRDLQRAHRVAHALRAGTVWVNSYRVVAPNAPFGGFKHSGMGRENGAEAMKQYTETKTIWVELSGATRDPFRMG